MIATFYEYGLICCQHNSLPMKEAIMDIKGTAFQFFHMNHAMLTPKVIDNYCGNVLIIIFCVSLPTFCEYDFGIDKEKDYSNRMKQSMMEFQRMVNRRELKDTAIVVLYTNKSKFAELIQYEYLSTHFDDYRGDPRSFDDTTRFIRQKCQCISERTWGNNHRSVFSHLIDDHNDIDDLRYKMHTDFQHVVIEASLRQAGLLSF